MASERRGAGQKVVERAAEAVDVGLDAGGLSVADLLRSDEVGRAEHLALVGQAAVERALARRLGQTEVQHLDDRLVPLAGEHQVARLDVAVDHPLLVGVLEPERGLVDEVAGMGDRHRPLGLDQLGQVESLDVLHGENDALAAAEGGIGVDDIGVLQSGRGADLAAEPLEDPFAFDQVLADDLEHLVTAHQPVVGEVDDPHASPTELADDLVVGMVGQVRGQRAGLGVARRLVHS